MRRTLCSSVIFLDAVVTKSVDVLEVLVDFMTFCFVFFHHLPCLQDKQQVCRVRGLVINQCGPRTGICITREIISSSCAIMLYLSTVTLEQFQQRL